MSLRNALYLILLGLLVSSSAGISQPLIIDQIVHAPSLEQSLLNTSPDRRVRVYLPPGYYESDRRYPVVYALHAYSMGIGGWHEALKEAAYSLWREEAIQPMILVAPDVIDVFNGSWYANTPVTGNWEDFITRDLVDYVDSTYRTIPQATSRGIIGNSMGGFEAMRLAMLHPEIFSVVYARSGMMGVVDLRESLQLARKAGPGEGFCAAFDPNPNKPPDFFDRFYGEEGEARLIAAHPLGMLDQYADNLRQLRGIAFDIGAQDQWTSFPPQNRAFSAAGDITVDMGVAAGQSTARRSGAVRPHRDHRILRHPEGHLLHRRPAPGPRRRKTGHIYSHHRNAHRRSTGWLRTEPELSQPIQQRHGDPFLATLFRTRRTRPLQPGRPTGGHPDRRTAQRRHLRRSLGRSRRDRKTAGQRRVSISPANRETDPDA